MGDSSGEAGNLDTDAPFTMSDPDEEEKADFKLTGVVNRQRALELIELARNFQVLPYSDDFRPTDVAKDGGFALDDKELLDKYRGAMKDLIK